MAKKRRNSLDKLDQILMSEEIKAKGRKRQRSSIDRSNMMSTISVTPRRDSAIIVKRKGDGSTAFPGMENLDKTRNGRRRRSFDGSTNQIQTLAFEDEETFTAASFHSTRSGRNSGTISVKRRGSAADVLSMSGRLAKEEGAPRAAATSSAEAGGGDATAGKGDAQVETTTTPVQPFTMN